jgi:hypothetical protein
MAQIDLDLLAPDATIPATCILFGADDQASGPMSVYPLSAIWQKLCGSPAVSDAANTLGLRNGTSAQRINLASSWTDAGNLSRAFIDAGQTTANTLLFGSEHLGTGGNALTKFQLNVDGTNVLDYSVGLTGYLSIARPVVFGTQFFAQANTGAVAPGVSFNGSGASGIYNYGANIGVSVSGTARLYVDSLGMGVANNGVFGSENGVTGTRDVGISRLAASTYGVGNGTSGNVSGTFKAATFTTHPVTVASLPSAATVGAGARMMVSDATQTLTAGIGAVVVGGGANKVPVISDGADWRIA